ncbi:MAG: thioesterase family protein [Nitriliruptoraceae bacterium]
MTRIHVRFHELDPYGHVNHAVFLHWFEQARVDLLEDLGVGLPRLARLGFQLVVVRVDVRFLRAVVAGDELVVHSDVVELRRASSRWHQTLTRGDEVVATNDLRSAVTDLDGHPRRAPRALVDALESLSATG